MTTPETLTTAEIKKQNCEKIFNYIYRSKRTSKQTIAQALALSMPTVSQNLKLLEGLGLIARNGFYESTGGRKAQMIYCVQDARVAIGITILEETIHLCVVDLFGHIIKEDACPLPFQSTEDYYRAVGNLVHTLVIPLPYMESQILGVGISIQGLVSSDGEQVVYGNILGNTGSTRQMFQRYLPYPCHLIHDTEASATAEFWHNEDIRDAIYLVLNRNMGGALIIGGKIHQGSGIVEHMTLVPGGKSCYCGKHGCVEAYCSANSLRQASGLPFELFFQQMRAGSNACRQVWDRYLHDLAVAIDNMRMLVGCQFMIGGFLQQFMITEDFDLLTKYIYETTAFPGIPISFIKSRHGSRSATLGAAIYYIDSFLKSIDSEV